MSSALFPDLLVQKYGGSSVATPEKVAAVAERIAQRRQEHQHIVVAVSAMGKTTDNLIAMAKEVAPNPSGREYDHLLACGEQIAVSMVALALQARGVPAVSITDSLLSPIVEGADVVFEIPDMPEAALRTMVAPMCLAQSLAVGLTLALD